MKDRKWLYSTYQEYSYWLKKWETYYNLPWLRSPKNHKYLLRTKVYIDELNKEYKIKRIPEQIMRNYDSWEDIHVSAYADRKSWKRNSKRSHQWK